MQNLRLPLQTVAYFLLPMFLSSALYVVTMAWWEYLWIPLSLGGIELALVVLVSMLGEATPPDGPKPQ